MGHDLGLETVDGIWREIESLAPSHAGITVELLQSPAADDGVLVPLRPEVADAAQGRPVQITGVQSTMPDSGALAAAAEASDEEQPPAGEVVEAVAAAEQQGPQRPPTVEFSRGEMYESPSVDAYALRLITQRKLYDCGTLVQHSPSMAHLAPGSTLLVHPSDLDRLGVADGGRLKIGSPRSSITLDAHASTAIPKGAAVLAVNQPGPDPFDLIDATQDVTHIRVETV
jgi:anaerobic selenocysteine-containing dehydrogenase